MVVELYCNEALPFIRNMIEHFNKDLTSKNILEIVETQDVT